MTAIADANIKIYQDILIDNGIQEKVSQVLVKAPDFASDQFASQCTLVTVNFKDGARAPLQLFVKVPVCNPEYAYHIKNLGMFEKEALFFNSILPELKTFVEEQTGYDGFLETLFPKCFFASESMLVFENIVPAGFYLWNKREPHNLDIAKMVFKNIAKLHAASSGYIQHLGLSRFEAKYGCINTKSNKGPEAESINGPWVQFCIDGAIKILKEKPIEGSEKALRYLKKYDSGGFRSMSELYQQGNQLCPDVLIHGDIWNGNVMFRNDPETNLPAQNILIDMQTILLGTPALDLQHYAFVAMDFHVLHSSWKLLLRNYYSHFKELVERLGQQALFSLEDLEADFKAKSLDGLFFGMYTAFAFDALEAMGDFANSEEDVGSNFTGVLHKVLDRQLEENGLQHAENVVKLFQVYEDIQAGKEFALEIA